jgi:hypothetical protein
MHYEQNCNLLGCLTNGEMATGRNREPIAQSRSLLNRQKSLISPLSFFLMYSAAA